MPITDSLRDGSAVARRSLVAPTTLVLTVALFGIVALSRRDILPDEATLLVSPALGLALLTDAVLYNDFGLREARPPLWMLLGPSLYLEAVAVVALARFGERARTIAR